MSRTANVSLLSNAHELEGQIRQIRPVIRGDILCVRCCEEVITSSSVGRIQYLFTVCFQAAAEIKVTGIKLRVYGSLLGIDSAYLHSHRILGCVGCHSKRSVSTAPGSGRGSVSISCFSLLPEEVRKIFFPPWWKSSRALLFICSFSV